MIAGTQNHLKTKRLKRLLKRPLYQVVGILESIWLLCIDCADEGDIGKFTNEEISDYLEWDGCPNELVRCLQESGWFDTDDAGRPVVHDWMENCPNFVKDRVRKRHARDCKRPIPNVLPTYESSDADNKGQEQDTPHLVPSIPNPTNPNQSESIPSAPLPPEPESGGQAGRNGFRSGWAGVADKLTEMGASRWREAINDAKDVGCNPGLAKTLIEYGKANGYGVGAIIVRLGKARPTLALDAGWPEKPAPKAKAPETKTDIPQHEARRTDIIRQLRKAKKSNDEINAALTAEGLSTI